LDSSNVVPFSVEPDFREENSKPEAGMQETALMLRSALLQAAIIVSDIAGETVRDPVILVELCECIDRLNQDVLRISRLADGGVS
jgi:hypothetical protein